MEHIINIPFGESIIERTADFICSNFLKQSNDLSRVACVFGGKRPSLFLRKALSFRIRSSYLPPHIFSMDEFIDYVVSGDKELPAISLFEASYLLYKLSLAHLPNLLKNRDTFSAFLPWAEEFFYFIEQLDLENVSIEQLSNIEKSARIGYEIPENINELLRNIVQLRHAFHNTLYTQKMYTRGLKYLSASEKSNCELFDEFDAVLFINFFYLHKTEKAVIKNIYDKGKGICIFQGDINSWPVLSEVRELFEDDLSRKTQDYPAGMPENVSTSDSTGRKPACNLYLYKGFDLHSQVCIAREIINNLPDKNKTVIVIPQPENLVPLLTEVPLSDELNVSLGYPIKGSSLYALFDLLFRVHETKKDGKYYTKDYLNLLRHPVLKNIKFTNDNTITRVLVHKIEDVLVGKEETSIGGSLFLKLEDIENEEIIYLRTMQTLKNMDIKTNIDECKDVLKMIHQHFFAMWGDVTSFYSFSKALGNTLDILRERSMLTKFLFNIKLIDKLYSLKEELERISFGNETFNSREVWHIFRKRLDNEMISFSGSPLRGLQILGLFETRSLTFDNVVVLGMNEGVLPKLRIYEPLIPREVVLCLGINLLEKEEEIQRYHFMRLISSAQNIYLVYEENQEKEKSRFIEELLWEKQKEKNRLEVEDIRAARFSMKVKLSRKSVKKTQGILEFLKGKTYSASSVDTYLNCPLKFYYKYVTGLRETEDLLSDIEAYNIGDFIHELLEDTFKQFIGIKPAIDKKFRRYFFKKMGDKFDIQLGKRMKSDAFLLKNIIKSRLSQFLDLEEKRDIEKIIFLEREFKNNIKINNDILKFVCRVDRIDEYSGGRIVIIDYKTGGGDVCPKRFHKLQEMKFNREFIRENIKSFQLPLYYHFISYEFSDRELNALLYNIRTLERQSFISEEDSDNKGFIMEICIKALTFIFNELFNPLIDFISDKDERKCQYCGFKLMCR